MGILEFPWRQFKKERAAVWLQSVLSALRFSCSVFPTVLLLYHLWYNQGKMGPFHPGERCGSMWLEIDFSFGNYRIHSDTFTFVAYSCQEQGPGRSPETWTKCMNLSYPPLGRTQRHLLCEQHKRWVLWMEALKVISMWLARKQPRRADSVTMATTSSREIMNQSD